MTQINTAPRFIAKHIDEKGRVRYVREFNPWRVTWTDDVRHAAQQLKWVFTSDFALIHPEIEIEIIPA
jgi:hypothetical protein